MLIPRSRYEHFKRLPLIAKDTQDKHNHNLKTKGGGKGGKRGWADLLSGDHRHKDSPWETADFVPKHGKLLLEPPTADVFSSGQTLRCWFTSSIADLFLLDFYCRGRDGQPGYAQGRRAADEQTGRAGSEPAEK